MSLKGGCCYGGSFILIEWQFDIKRATIESLLVKKGAFHLTPDWLEQEFRQHHGAPPQRVNAHTDVKPGAINHRLHWQQGKRFVHRECDRWKVRSITFINFSV